MTTVQDSEIRTRNQATRPSLMWLLGSSVLLAVSWPIGLALFIIWTVVVALSLFTVVLPLQLPVAATLRGYAGLHRRWAARVLGTRAQGGPAASRTQPRPWHATLVGRLTAALRDPSTWRQWAWCLVNATVGFALALLPVVLFASIWLYLCYPLLYAVTPQEAFGTVFGVFELRSVADAWLVTPMALVCAALWLATARSFPRASARIMVTMLGAREEGDTV